MKSEIIEADLDLENWITGTSYAQAKVTIYRNPALIAEYEPLLAQIEELEQATPQEVFEDETLAGVSTIVRRNANEASLADGVGSPELDSLYEQAEALHARFQADCEVWTLRALEPTEIDELRRASPKPMAPKPLKPDATAGERAEHQKARDAYAKALEAWSMDFNLRAIALAVLSVTVAEQPVTKPDLNMLTALPARPGGYRHAVTLGEAIMQVSGQEVTLLAPHRKRA